MKSPLTRFLLALAVLVGSLGVYGAWYAAVSAKSAAVANLGNQITTNTETMTRIASARSALAQIAGDESLVQNYFVSESNIVAFINDLEARGAAQGATVSVLSVSSDTSSTHTALTLSLAVKGSFNSVVRTIGSIEYAPYDLSIGTLSVGLDAKNSWHANLDITVGTNPATSTPASGTTPITNSLPG